MRSPRKNGHPVHPLAAAITRVGGSSQQVDLSPVAEGKKHVVHLGENLRMSPDTEPNRVQHCNSFLRRNGASSDEGNVRFVGRHEGGQNELVDPRTI